MARRKKKLTEEEWQRVFKIRCRSKQGLQIAKEDQSLTDRAYESDQERYAAMEADVFDATVPFGSSARWPR